MGSSVFVPRRLAEEIEKRGLNLEDTIIEALSEALNFDPKTIAESRLELAERYLAEGRSLVDKDPVQASEKLYKAAEECVKALAMHFNLENILRGIEKRAVSAFIIICSAHVHWFLRPLNAMRYAESHEISKYERR